MRSTRKKVWGKQKLPGIPVTISNIIVALFACLLAGLLPPAIAHSQSEVPQGIVVHSVETIAESDGMTLDVYFTLTDANGMPLPDVNFETATIELLNQDSEVTQASIIKPEAPLYIALVIDASGSMADAIEDVKNAARAAIDRAPPNAQIGLFQFNENLTMLEQFTPDRERVIRAVDAVATDNLGTCLYDSVYEVIDLLEQQVTTPQERTAVILFTDGRDQLTVDSPEPCSRRSYEDVVALAQPPSRNLPGTPIHTIGMYGAQSQDNINEEELRNMAVSTGAFSVIGGQGDLSSLFQQIMDGLNSQWVARAKVLPDEGNNQAILTITTRDSGTALLAPFGFTSPTAYNAPLPDPRVTISSIQYNAENDIYLVGVSIANNQSVFQLIANVWDSRGGIQVSRDYTFVEPDSTLQIEIETAGFEPEREYAIRLQAIDRESLLFQDEDGSTILAEAEVEYSPALPEPVSFNIQSVTADYAQSQLLIDLDLSGVNMSRIASYEGFMVDEATGQRVPDSDFGPQPLTGGRVQTALPPALQQAETPGEYRLTMYLTTQEGLRTESIYEEFAPVPPEPPGLLSRIGTALIAAPILLGAIGFIIFSVIGVIYLGNRARKKRKASIPRPPVEKTRLFTPPPPVYQQPPSYGPSSSPGSPGAAGRATPFEATPEMSLTIVDVPGHKSGERRQVTSFPFTVGRAGCDLNIDGDRRISRQHLEIRNEQNRLFIVDMSRNGTVLDDNKLTHSQPVQLGGVHQIRLGSCVLKVEVMENDDPFR